MPKPSLNKTSISKKEVVLDQNSVEKKTNNNKINFFKKYKKLLYKRNQ